jgi:hypothetical protein
LLKARRRNSDRRRMARSSWFYGGDVALPEDQVSNSQDTRPRVSLTSRRTGKSRGFNPASLRPRSTGRTATGSLRSSPNSTPSTSLGRTAVDTPAAPLRATPLPSGSRQCPKPRPCRLSSRRAGGRIDSLLSQTCRMAPGPLRPWCKLFRRQ